MSRSGYSSDIDNWQLIKWGGWVASAIKGKRGQAFLRELIAALDAMPEKRLIDGDLVSEDGADVCALGALGKLKGIDMSGLDTYDHEGLGAAFGIAYQLAAEVMFINDDEYRHLDPEGRWRNVREWAKSNLRVASV